jgi:large subunit ribosomal protein L21
MTSAIIQTGGKQYRVLPGQLVTIEKLNAEPGSTITFDKVLAVTVDGSVELGTPFLASHIVSAEVVEQAKGDKIRVFTYKAKKRQRRTLGHRQPLTVVRVVSIGSAKEEGRAKATEKPANAEKPAKAEKPKAEKATKTTTKKATS